MDYLIFGGAILLFAGFLYYQRKRKGTGGSAPRDGDGPPKFKL